MIMNSRIANLVMQFELEGTQNCCFLRDTLSSVTHTLVSALEGGGSVLLCFIKIDEVSDTPLIGHLVMREFVSAPPSYRFIYERVGDRKPSLRKGS